MSDPYADWDDKKYFYGWVFLTLLDKFPFIEKILHSLDLNEEVFQSALKLGYNRNVGEKFNKQVTSRFLHDSYHPISIELLENNYCENALFQLIQERIKNSEVFPEDIQFLKQILAKYDPITPDFYLEPIPQSLTIPEFKKDTWVKELKFEFKDLENDSSDWFTICSSKTFQLSDFHEQGVEYEDVCTAFVKSNIEKQTVDSFEITDLFEIPICKTLYDFKKLPSISKENTPLFPFIIIKNNQWRLHSPNKLVRLDQKFMDVNNLIWQENTILDLQHEGDKILKYQLWAAPFDGNSNTRHRISHGVKIQIKKDFLKEYLEKNILALLMIVEKKRKLANTGINETKIIESNKIKKTKMYTYKDILQNYTNKKY